MYRTSTAALVALGLMSATISFAQTPSPIPSDLSFEVASLKRSVPGGRDGGMRPAAGGQRYQATNCPLKLMLQVAWRVKAEQIQGGPGWLETDTFDMDAKAERPASSDELMSC